MAKTKNLSKITPNQYRVLRLVKQGLSVTEIADQLGFDFYTTRRLQRQLRDLGFVQTARGRRSTVTVDLRRVRPSGL